MQFRLIRTLLGKLLSQPNNIELKRQISSSENINHAIVVQLDFKIHLLQDATVSSGSSIGVGLSLGPSTSPLSGGPKRGGGGRFPQLHVQHVVLLLVLDVQTLRGDLAKVQVAPRREHANHVHDAQCDAALFISTVFYGH